MIFLSNLFMDLSFLPKTLIRRIADSDADQINWNVFLSNVIVITIGGILLAFDLRFYEKIPHVCLVKEVIGIPCPGCGIIRSIVELANFRFLSSIHYNPVGVFVVFSIFSQTLSRLLLIAGFLSQRFIDNQTKIINTLVITLLLANWLINLILTLKL
jgi:hypothetical protein